MGVQVLLWHQPRIIGLAGALADAVKEYATKSPPARHLTIPDRHPEQLRKPKSSGPSAIGRDPETKAWWTDKDPRPSEASGEQRPRGQVRTIQGKPNSVSDAFVESWWGGRWQLDTKRSSWNSSTRAPGVSFDTPGVST